MEQAEFALPQSGQEWQQIKEVLLMKYNLEDNPKTWLFVISQIMNTPMPELKTSYERIHAFYQRWKIAEVMHAQKEVEIEKLKVMLEAHATPSEQQPDTEV